VDPLDILPAAALDVLAERLSTPLQIEHYLTRILEQAYRLGEKPVTPAIVEQTLAPDMHDLEPTLTRYGYNVKPLAELLNIRQAEVRAFLHGQLPPGRTEEIHHQLLAAGLPLGERFGVVEHRSATG
jgi:N-acetyl-anhydromuramyl-L-alanine amidase AmpD